MREGCWTARTVVKPERNRTFCRVCNGPGDTILLKPGMPLATMEYIEPKAIIKLAQSMQPTSRTQKDREKDWVNLLKIGVKLENKNLSTEKANAYKDILIDNKDHFATDLSQLSECSALSPHEIFMKNETPIRQRCYRQTPEANAEIRR